MRVTATSYLTTEVKGDISEAELRSALVSAGLKLPDGAAVRFWASGHHADVEVDEHAPLLFSIVYQSDRVTTPPASDPVGNQT